VTAKQQDDRRTAGKGSTFPPSVVSPHLGPQQQLHSFTQTATSRDVMEPAKSASIGFTFCVSNPSDLDANLPHNYSLFR